MKAVDHDTLVRSLKPGDIGLIYSNNVFAKVQALYAHRFKEGPAHASHGFMMKYSPALTEANGIVIKPATVLKFIGDTTECWLFRNSGITDVERDRLMLYAQGAEETAGHYSVGGILQFAKSFVTGQRGEADEQGVFCSEYTSRMIVAAGLPYMENLKPWEIDPTTQLNFFLSPEAKAKGWITAAHYDGKQGYFIDDTAEKEAA